MKVKRGKIYDLLQRDGSTAVLIPGRLVVLDGLAAEILTRCGEARDLDDLASELERELGTPADGSARQSTEQAVTDLVRHGLLRCYDAAP